ncbi:hypothetical protein LCGC14_1750610 [marine sediment metagenome]|uniref:Polysaccharide pyruvyl transferase domain-containing protein n=1 Tax=marine sediment metagenome TaxID=412755 RepID=A0A0F9H415_9ZZZZ
MGYKYPYVPTLVSNWKSNNNKKICYQFDAKSNKGQRFPSEEAKEKILTAIKNEGYEVVKLGKELTLEECIQETSKCEAFLGIDSGMLYLASSVGVPIFYCINNRGQDIWETAHPNKHATVVKDYLELIDTFAKFSKEGLDYYLKNARNIHLFKERLSL